ncbi:MAG: c-type cytochrome [Sphingobacteriales bacterium]|nr:c-type cytochrome [Sphingobacteriales bacterium]
MKKKFIYVFAVLAAGLIVLNACRHEILHPGNGGSGTGGGTGGGTGSTNTCSPDTVYFVNDIMPLISSNCTMSGCHDAITHAEGVNLTSYDRIVRYVSPGNASGSKLYKEIIKTGNDRMPPPPMPAFTAAQKALLQKWINQGAKNNSCVGRCDTAVFTYSGAIKPIMDAKCAGCHNPNNLGGNIDVSTYNPLKTVALNGKLYGSVAHQLGYSPMPKGAAKLSDCEITQIQKWIAAGTLNN